MALKLELLVGLSGPEYSLSPGETRDFEGELVDGEATGEAGRLIDAGFAKLAEDQADSGDTAAVTPKKTRKKAD